jgi:aryl-alcohol dehydrogenase-like predicted oxidoreductase
LRTDYIDLYQLHTPDVCTPIGETLGALEDLRRAGKIRAIGCSNYPANLFLDTLAEIKAHDTEALASHQVRYNLLSREVENGVLPLCRTYGVAVIAHTALAGGALTNRRAALAFVISRPGVASALVGASRPEQIKDTLAAWDQSAIDEEAYLCA